MASVSPLFGAVSATPKVGAVTGALLSSDKFYLVVSTDDMSSGIDRVGSVSVVEAITSVESGATASVESTVLVESVLPEVASEVAESVSASVVVL